MNKKCKQVLTVCLLLVLLCCVLAACGKTVQRQYEIASYQGQPEEGQTKSGYNKQLFYRNDKSATGADPFVLDNTGVDGYYYMYVTEGSLFCYRSRDLMDWEPVGNTLANLDYADKGAQTEFRRVTYDEIWAPEVIYDADEQRYYMFFSATPDISNEAVGEGVLAGDGYQLMLVAVSQRPDRDFTLVNFRDAESCGQENLHSYNEQRGIKNADGEYEDAYPHYYAKYLLFDPAAYKAFSQANGGCRGEPYGGYEGGIDPHPYVDEDGTKYLFWVDSTASDRLSVVKMDNWLKPDWSTATVVAYHNYYTVADWHSAQAGQSVEHVSYELESVEINEGPTVLKHKGKYYLTFSVGSYKDSSYQVAQAVSDNIMGPYRKLTEAEGGVVMSGGTSGSQEISGTGHHTFVTVGDQLYMLYHRHNDFVTAGSARNPAVDEMKWITVKDINGNDLDVLYSNGPTCTVQPRLEGFAEYVNIADEATVTGSEDAQFLNDGLLSVYKYADPEFSKYVQEATITGTTTFTFDFDRARTVRAVMVYNSKMESTAFAGVARMEFVCEENGQEVVRFIKNVQFSPENFKANEYDNSLYYITPGAAAYAEFGELNVKSVRITLEVPEGQESVGISEVKILGK